jgi:hypothetical protein
VTAVHDHRGRVDLGGRVARLLQDLARRNADAVVGRRHIDQIGRVNIQRDGRRLERLGVVTRLRLLPALRVAEEELHRVRAVHLRGRQRVVVANMGTDEHSASLVTGADEQAY